MNQEIGKWIIALGLLIVLAGIIWYFFHDKLNWLGNLPGDFKVEKENFRFYFPLATMLLLSLLLNIIVWVVKKIFQ
jgi:H+/Cl- antiporter ClcA